MRTLPQRGFSRARRRMRSRTCVGMHDRPRDLLDRHFQVQYCRQAVRCQRMTVSGWRMIRRAQQEYARPLVQIAWLRKRGGASGWLALLALVIETVVVVLANP